MKKIILKVAETEYILVILFGLFIIVSHIFGFASAKIIQEKFWLFFVEMITFLPFMFILVGLFDVWFPKEKVEKHIGEGSGPKGAILCILLAMLQAGPLYGAFPVAYLLWKKGSNIRNIFIYLGAILNA
ncbi:MAG: permease [bacterium]